VAKQMDWSLGVPSMLMNPNSKRRALYGKAGAFRPKSYGCEYRTPDNSWLTSRDRMIYMFNNAVMGMDKLMEGTHFSDRWNASNVINRSQVHYGLDYMRNLGIELPVLDKKTLDQAKKANHYA
jgi:phiEco32-like amidoligase-type 2 protein